MTLSIANAKALAKSQQIDALDADVLLAFVLQKPRTYLFTWPEQALSEAQSIQYQALLDQRQLGRPVAHLTGEREFYSLPLSVNNSTLIPRPDTETLVECLLSQHNNKPLVCLDLGTGTGAIALALKSERPNWAVTGVDFESDAVKLAQHNAKKLNLNVRFEQGDWASQMAENSIDVLVSNPPYIDENDPHLLQGDVRFEPLTALVADENGLKDIRVITEHAKRVLKPNGWLYFEHGWQQANAVRQILSDAGFAGVSSQCDLAGHERVSYGQWCLTTSERPSEEV